LICPPNPIEPFFGYSELRAANNTCSLIGWMYAAWVYVRFMNTTSFLLLIRDFPFQSIKGAPARFDTVSETLLHN